MPGETYIMRTILPFENQFVIACADYETILNWNNMVTPEIKSLIYLDFLLV